MKKFLFAIIFILLGFFSFSSFAFAAKTYTIALVSGYPVTMGDASSTLCFRVTNTSTAPDTGAAIRQIDFNFSTTPTVYEFSPATTAPSGFTVDSYTTSRIEFRVVPAGSGITAGNYLDFCLVVTGPNQGSIMQDAQDVTTDTFSAVNVTLDTDFTRIGGIPIWTRKSLAISLVATPSSVGVGDTITVTMNVTNRSTATQSGITANPDPPGRTYSGGAGVTLTGGPTYSQTALTSNIDDSQTTIPVSSTSGFPSSGRIQIDNELIDYTGTTATSFTGATRGVGGTTATSHTQNTTVYGRSSLTLSSGESSTITWTFSADATGTVYFTSSAENSGVTATSKSRDSNVVVIGDFTAIVTATPLSVISGQTVTVKMTVSNNGSSTLTDITPTLTSGGTATATLSSGPTPSSISSLGVGESGIFEWEYTITGSEGQTYYFEGYATSGAQITNTSTSEEGEITQYAVTVTPSTVATGTTTNTTFTWTVYNRGGYVVKEVNIGIPLPRTSDCVATQGWGYVSDTPPANWTSTTAGTPVSSVTFSANNPVDTYGIPVGGSKDFEITFNCVPQVTSDTDYNFPVLITDKNNNQATVNTTITVTAYLLILTAYDEDCTAAAPASKPADGDSRYCMKAELTSGGSPASGKTINFSITAGLGFLSSSSVVTDSNGIATVYLTSPCSTEDVSTTVKAEYTTDTYDTETVLFTGVGGSNLSYVNDSLTFNRTSPPPTGDINPVSINTDDTGTFKLQLRNCGTTPITIQIGTLPANTTLAIRRGSADTFTLSSDVTIDAGATATLDFDSGTISSGTLQCYPFLTVNAGSGYTGTFSYYNSTQGDFIPTATFDTVTVNDGTECPPLRVIILDWREVMP